MPLRYPINLHKGLTGALVLTLMIGYGNFSVAAWTYLALHGSYGLLWLLKDRLYPDRQWERKVSVGYSLVVFAGLGLYWIAPFVLISQHREPAPWMIGLAVALNMWGSVLHFAADAQKYFTLRHHPSLITDGFFARCRHTNYLGELMIYSGFALLSASWAGWIGILLFFPIVFIPNMIRKERSLARYPEFEAYKKRSGFLWPRV